LQRGLLTIRGAKFGKSRLVPVHHSTRHVLEQYAKVRDAQLAHPAAGHFFVSERGQVLNASTVRNTFRQLCIQIGLHAPEDRSGPRLHDYRHNSGCRIIPGVRSVVVRMWRRCSAVFGGAS
jgi:site-specific recombinase XerD